MDWCVSKDLPLQRNFMGYRILMVEPGNERARKVVGLPRPKFPVATR